MHPLLHSEKCLYFLQHFFGVEWAFQLRFFDFRLFEVRITWYKTRRPASMLSDMDTYNNYPCWKKKIFFCWDMHPLLHSEKCLYFLQHFFGVEWAFQLRFFDFRLFEVRITWYKTRRPASMLSDMDTYNNYPCWKKKIFFCWDMHPLLHSEKCLYFLQHFFGVEWAFQLRFFDFRLFEVRITWYKTRRPASMLSDMDTYNNYPCWKKKNFFLLRYAPTIA